MATPNIKAPFGVADTLVLAATGTTALTISNRNTVIDGVTTQITGNATINLTLDSRLELGSTIYLKTSTAATQTVTFGTGFTCPTLTGVAGKTFVTAFVYDGSKFLPTAAPYQIN
jgi:hypothetical protein